MNLLLDTHLLLWAAGQPDRLSAPTTRMLSNGRNIVHFGVVSLWEIAIKRTLGRREFQVDARQLRRGLIEHGYSEVLLTADKELEAYGGPVRLV